MRKHHPYLITLIWLLLLTLNLCAQSKNDTFDLRNEVNTSVLLNIQSLPDTSIDLSNYTSVYIDRNRDLKIEDARLIWQSGQFLPLDNLVYPKKFESGNYHYWLQFQLRNSSRDIQELILRLPRIDSSFLYQVVDNQLDKAVLFGNKLNLKSLRALDLSLPSSHAVPIQLLPNTHYQFYIRASDNLYLTAKLQPIIESPYVFFKGRAYKQFYLSFADTFFLGILFFIGLFTLLQYFQNKDKAFLFYAIYVGLLFLANWLLFERGNMLVKFFQNWTADFNYVYVPHHISIYCAYTLFVHYFINPKNQYPFLTKFIRFVLYLFGAYLFISVAISIFIDVKYSWILHYYFRILLSVLMLIFLFNLWKIGTRLAYYLIFGSISLLFLTIIAPAIFSLAIKDQMWMGKDFNYYVSQVGILIELLFFSLGLGYKRYLSEQEEIKTQQENIQLVEFNNFKNQFYTNITHEFRTPLTVILGLVNELKDDSEKEEYKAKKLILQNGQNLLNLVNEMLDLAKLENESMPLDLEQADIIPFVKYVCGSFESMAQEKDITLTVDTSLSTLIMDYDATKISSFLTNLLSNSLKFTAKNGIIDVVFSHLHQHKKDYFQIKIKDNGIGIDQADLPNIFNRFYQSKNVVTQPTKGSGIGLALCKELVNLMNGTIDVKSQLGKGTEFTIHLPISNIAPLAEGFILENNLNPVSPKENKDAIQKKAAAEDLPIALIIEDNPDLIYYLKRCLENEYSLLYAANGYEGIELAFKKIPDIIISDVMMPMMDGYEVCDALKKDERTNHIPIIMLTAKAAPQDKLKGLSLGADAYLTKPFEKEELLIRLNKLMEIRQTLQLKYQINNNINESNFTKPLVETKKDPFLIKIESLTKEHLADDAFSGKELAKLLFLSDSQVYRKIKAVTGMSTAIFIRFIRVEKGKELLISTDLSVSEIAYRVGFKSPVYFGQVFKETFGKSPSDIRNQANA